MSIKILQAFIKEVWSKDIDEDFGALIKYKDEKGDY